MNINFNILNNLKKIQKKIILIYNFTKIKFFLIDYLKKNYKIKIFFCNSKVLLNYFIKKLNFPIYIIIINNNDQIYDFIKKIFYLLNKEPILLIFDNFFIKKIPLKEISKLSKINLLIKFFDFLKQNLIKFLNLLKQYEKNFINRNN